jgi:HEAT repeat protein
MALPVDADESRDRTLHALELLGTAWSTFLLYPEPSSQPAFLRAVDLLSVPLDAPLLVGVGPGTFLDGEEEYDIRREGAERLARELFLHDIEFLRIRGGLTAEDLIAFFHAVDTDDEETRQDGGLQSVVAELGDIGIEVYERGLLVVTEVAGEAEAGTDPALLALLEDTEGLSEAAAAANHGAEPEEVAALLAQAEQSGEGEVVDPAVYAFLKGLEELHAHATPYVESVGRVTGALREGATDPWKGFRTFLEAFFHMPRAAQLMVLESVVQNGESVPKKLFLDQLSGADLADYLPELSEGGQEALTAYAVVVGSEAGRPDGAAPDPTATTEVSSARQAVAARISEVLASGAEDRSAAEGLLAELRADMSADIDDHELSAYVVRGLLECEHRSERFDRVVRVWTGRVARLLREGEWERGQRLLDAVLQDPPYAAEKEEGVRQALERIAGRETMARVVGEERGAQPSDHTLRLVETMGGVAVGPLVEMLAREDDAQTRRMLTELLAHAARSEPRALDPHLVAQPWYVVRNLATVLAKTGRQGAVPSLSQLLTHEDHRVRVEALRGLVRIQRGEAGPTLVRMLEDPHDRVRQNAATLARSAESSEIDALLVRALEEDRFEPDAAARAIQVLAGRGTAESRNVVESLARRRFAVKGGSRAVRDAARRALREMGQ